MAKWIRDRHETEYHDITPQLAAELLALSRGNRGIRPVVNDYKRDMAERRFIVWDGPLISRSGRLLNWHHRLTAQIDAGVTLLRVPVMMGIPDEALVYIDDKAAKRSNAQILQFDGEKHTYAMASSLRVVEGYLDGSIRSGFARQLADVRASMAAHPEIRRSVTYCRSLQHSAITHTADFCGLHYLFSKVSAADADGFVVAVSSGVGLEATNAAWVLRERLIKAKSESKKARLDDSYRIAIIIKSWEAWRTRRPVALLRMKLDGSETFPRITGIKVPW